MLSEVLWTASFLAGDVGAPAGRRRAVGATNPRNPRHSDGIKGGRKRVSDTFWTRTVFDALRGAQQLLYALFGVTRLSGILFGPALSDTRVTWVMGLGGAGAGTS